MNLNTFNALVDNQFKACKNMLCNRRAMYSNETDVLENFKQSARDLECSVERANLGMVIKQWTALKKYIRELDNNLPTFEAWTEKITDIINYMILLQAIVIDQEHYKDAEINAGKYH